MERKRVLSGTRPTGKLHLGHLVGVLDHWVKLQDEYECFYPIVTWHALTTGYADPSRLREYTLEVAMDFFAVGLDPERSVIFIQSDVPLHAELHLLLSMIVPVPWLERVPSYKEQQRELPDRDLSTYGFLGYPLLQTADIIIYKANYVPVGEDQVPHVELAREIVRRFNNLYRPVFPEPQALLTKFPRLLGLDGRKMSKSYQNVINLADSAEEIEAKVKTMLTDRKRARRSDPGRPSVCNLFPYHRLFTDKDKTAEIDTACRKAKIGCTDCKKVLSSSLIEFLAPIREKRRKYEDNPKLVWDILAEGGRKARKITEETMAEVREAMGLTAG